MYKGNSFGFVDRIVKKLVGMKIGILYIGIGKYLSLWDDFYKTSQKYLFPDAEKIYFVFTDSDDFFPESVVKLYQKDLGGRNNTLYRFKMFYEHRIALSQCDYLFFFNGDVIFKRTILSKELIPCESEGYLLALSWHIYQIKSPKKFPYDRNPNSLAYISYDEGVYYFQGGLNGGRTKEYLELAEQCMIAVDIDVEKNNIAAVAGESYLNRYLLNKKIKIVDTIYGKPEKFFFPIHAKIIFRDKGTFFHSKGIEHVGCINYKPALLRFFIDLSKYLRYFRKKCLLFFHD